MSETELEKLHAKMDLMLSQTADINTRLSCLEVLADSRGGRCDAHGDKLQEIDTTIRGNGKPGILTTIATLTGKLETLAAAVEERFKGLSKEVVIYSVIGGAISTALMTVAVAVIATKLSAETGMSAKTMNPTIALEILKESNHDRNNRKDIRSGNKQP